MWSLTKNGIFFNIFYNYFNKRKKGGWKDIYRVTHDLSPPAQPKIQGVLV